MSKGWMSRGLALAVAIVMALSVCAVAQESMEIRPQDDLYAAVNAEWLAGAEIPPHKVMVGGFADLADMVEQMLMADFAAMSEETAAGFEALPEFLKFYAMTADYETRNAQGAEPLAPWIAEIDALSSLADLDAVLPGFILSGIPAPLNAGTAPDMGNAQHHALYVEAPSLFLPDESFYGTPTGDYLLEAFGQILGVLLQHCGYGEEDAAQIAEQAIAFDALVKPYIPTAEEASDYTKLYNPMAVADFAANSAALDLAGLVEMLVPSVPEYVVITNPAYFAALDELITEENFPLIKSWMKAMTIYGSAAMLSEGMEEAATAYGMIITGQAEMEDPMKRAYRLANSFFDGPIGVYFGKHYFGEEAKQDVTDMVEQMIQVYRGRLQNNNWLGEQTIEAALRKLDGMALQIGYPDRLQPEYALFSVVPTEEGGTVMGNAMAFLRIVMEENMAKCGQKVDHTLWNTGAATVNAFFNPMANAIIFPAAILQEPFYSLEQSKSRNLGGMGAVIAHEITHAFDSNGSKFDEYGSLNDWWTEADYAAFGERIQAMIAQFDGIPYGDGFVNGTLTVSENIADLGGLSSALEVCESLADPNLQEFFEGWATIWRMKVRPELEPLLLLGVHAPNELRTNMPVRNLDAFFEVYGVVEGDGMYRPLEERIAIW